MGDQLQAAVTAGRQALPRPALRQPRVREFVQARLASLGWLEREAFLVVLVTIYVVGLTRNLPGQIASDTWMTLAYGREVVHNGLPSHDLLTVWAHGREWVDQQWLGQLIFYGVFVAGGIRAAVVVNTVALASAIMLAVVAARRRGGSTRSVTWFALLSFLVVAWSSWTLRVQSLVFPLFVGLLWLLAADSRRPSRRVLLALPLLVVWANVHGTAFLGAGLIALRGLSMLLERDRPWRARVPTAGVLMASPVLLLASPYGLSLVDYYHRLLLNPAFGRYVTEWAPTRFDIGTAPFYAMTLLAAWLVGRSASRLTRFEQASLLVTVVLAWLAVRSVVWFVLAALVLLPIALDGVLESRWESPRFRFLNKFLAFPAPVIGAVLAVAALSHPASWYTRDFPAAAAASAARIANAEPQGRVFANERFADWLVLEHPELRGRIAFDGRFELLTAKELERVVSFRARIVGSTKVTRGYSALVLDPSSEKKVAKDLLASSASRHEAYSDDHIVVIRQEQGPTG